MSYIDMFKHEQLTEIIGLPLYRAQEDIEGDEFNAKQGQLILGGGGGEHPAIVIKHIDSMVARYIWTSTDTEHSYDYIECDYFENLEFVDWMILTYKDFFTRAVQNGYNEDEDGYVEAWLCDRLSQYLLENQKGLINPELIKISEEEK